MFSNLEELIEAINKGASNEEIISTRINYLKSDEYKNSRIKDIREKEKSSIINGIFDKDIELGDDNVVIFKDGFIDENFVVSHQSGKIDWSDGYVMDDYSVYSELLNYIRINIDTISKKGGLSSKEICRKVKDYFKLSSDSQYYSTCEYLRKWYESNETFILPQKSSDLFIRYELPEIINSYKASDFKGSIEDYTKLYVDHYYNHYYGLKENENDEFLKINFDEQKLFSPTKISDIKHTGAVACTEYSLVLQNCLTFLGYESYMIGGAVNGGGHNYNVLRDKNGKYRVIDIAQLVYGSELENISTPLDLTSFGERKVKNGRNRELSYTSEFSEAPSLSQKNCQLTLLEIEERKLSDKVHLIDKQKENNSPDLGE